LRALAALVGLATALGAVAYGAARQMPGVPHPAAKPGSKHPAKSHSVRPPRPRLTEHPGKLVTSTTARFAFVGNGANLRFECRLDGARWKICSAPVDLVGLASGSHTFSVRSLNRRGRRSRSTRFRWTLLAPKEFSIVPQLANLRELYPGDPPVPLPLVVSNPNPVPIFVTSLRVSVIADPAGCASATNLSLGHAGASPAAPIEVPAGGSVSLPAPGVAPPTIQLRDLPVNQDTCQNTRFPLEFSGSARG
jgi:hypothetical protein